MTDLDGASVPEVVPSRTEEGANKAWKTLSDTQRERIVAAAIDMSAAYEMPRSMSHEKPGRAEYRRQGLPLTSSHIESTIKQIYVRMKGSEKFFRRDSGEALLQLRADSLCDRQPLQAF